MRQLYMKERDTGLEPEISLLGRQNVTMSPLAYCRMTPGGRLPLTCVFRATLK